MLRAHDSTRVDRRGFLRVAALITLLSAAVSVSALTLSGIAEGAGAILPPSVLTTSLTFQATSTAAASQLEFTLEGNGLALLQVTSRSPASVTFSNLYAGKYFLSTRSIDGPAEAADISFAIERPSFQPENDRRGLAGAISGFDQRVVGTNLFASTEPEEPQHTSAGGGRSIWWRWQASSNGIVTVTTAGSTFDTVLAVYTLTNAFDLALLGANDDAALTGPHSQVTFSARAGTTYFIAVDGAIEPAGSVATGRAELRVLAGRPPSVVIVAPTNGASIVVKPLSNEREIGARASVSDDLTPSAVQVDYQLDGDGLTRSGSLNEPYDWSLGQLPPGDYLLTVIAVNQAGLIATAHASFSLLVASARFEFVEKVPMAFQFGLIGLKGTAYELQAASDLAGWDRLALWTNFDGAVRFTDTNAPGFRTRFYRTITP